MITEITLLYIIAGFLFVMMLLLISGLKGINEMIKQRNTIFAKQYEWMNDIYSLIYKTEDTMEKPPLIIGEEKPITDHQAMFEDGVKKINEINEKKSKNRDDM